MPRLSLRRAVYGPPGYTPLNWDSGNASILNGLAPRRRERAPWPRRGISQGALDGGERERPSRRRKSGCEPDRLAECLLDRCFALLRTDRQPVGSDELRLDADEAEQRAQIAFEMLERCGGRTGVVDPTARKRDDHALAADQPFRAGRGVAEGLAGDRDAVDPR